jgi:PAS domain S-box-containing protein
MNTDDKETEWEGEPPDPAQSTVGAVEERFMSSYARPYLPPGLSADSRPREGSWASLLNWLDVSPDALVVVNQVGQITLVNSMVETLFGYSHEELIGQSLEALLPERFHAIHSLHRERYVASPRTRPMGAGLELYGRRKDGTEVPVDISLSPLLVDGLLYVLGAIRDITERRRLQEREHIARAEAEERLEFLQLILDELPTGVYLVQGEEARLVLANRAAASLWGAIWRVGQSMQDFLTTNCIRVFNTNGEELPPAALATLRAVQQDETQREYQEVIHHADGTALPVLVNAVVLNQRLLAAMPVDKGEDGDQPSKSVGPVALLVQQDVTERMELERRKDEFIGMASHELKTPVTSIKTYVQVLHRRLTKQGDEQSATVMTKIDTQLGTLTRLINELLDITNMTTGALSWHEVIFALDALVREVVEDLQRGAEHHQIIFENNEPVQISADRERIGQVLANLLTNAIKYTPQGGTIVVKQILNGEMVMVSVEDSGIGIPQEEQGHVFERFYRVRSSEHETFPGLGLGLYLSAEIVKRQGGRIWVESQPGIGSTFFFTLRVRPQPETMNGDEG